MSITSAYLTIRGIHVDITYKDIKHLHIGVYPPMGRVRVSAPKRLDEDQVRLAVIKRLPWIKHQRAQLLSVERQSEREMVTGESHYVWGVRRRLKVVERPGRSHVEFDGDRLILYVSAGRTAEHRRTVLDAWYRAQLRDAISDLISVWETKLDTRVPDWTVRRMRTKWGTCNRQNRRLTFNSELAKKHPDCLEYIVVHEMIHYFERNHGNQFTKLLDDALPNWRARRDLLTGAPLADENWGSTAGG